MIFVTFEEMRAEMRRKVVPENVVPQNIVEYLMDDSAELPELDAFTFLSRLRALGIGSADFQYLLEGCGAPAECVEKIKKNPAMNLQNLILTLESSGMTSQDYTVMLYTARQIWERTLTIRLEQAEDIAEAEEKKEFTTELPAENPEAPEYVADIPEADEDDEEADISFGEPSLTEVLEQVRLLEAEMSYTDDDDEKERYIPVSAEETEDTSEYDEEEELPESDDENEKSELFEVTYNDRADYESAPAKEEEEPHYSDLTASFSKVFDIIKGKKAEEAEENTDEYEDEEDDGGSITQSISVTTILAGMQKSEKKAASPEYPDEDESEDNIPAEEDYYDEDEEEEKRDYYDETATVAAIDKKKLKKQAEEVKTAKSKKLPEKEEEPDEDEEEAATRKHGYRKGALVVAGLGAAALVGFGLTLGNFSKKTAAVDYAEDYNEIFSHIYDSYGEEKFVGGELAGGFTDKYEVFGDHLISRSGYQAFCDEKCVYTITPEKISAEGFDGAILVPMDDILPPDKTSIVTAFMDGGELVCLFSGERSKECGFMRIRNGAALFTVRQDGALCDFDISGDKIAIGSVYSPKYAKSFSAEDPDVFMARVGKDEKKPVLAEDTVMSGAKGTSFAVCAEYSLKNGDNEAAKAVIGDPVFASADYKAAINVKGEEADSGLLVDFKDKVIVEKCSKMTAAAFGEGFAATLENGAVNIRDEKMKAKAELSNLAEKAESFKVSENVLLVGNENGFFAAFGCKDAKMPEVKKLAVAQGVISGDLAATLNTEDGLEIRCFERGENGSAKKLFEYTLNLNEERQKTLRLYPTENIVLAKDVCGAAYEYFDGVSVVSEYAAFGAEEKIKTLYDDKAGFKKAFVKDGKIYAESAEGAKAVN